MSMLNFKHGLYANLPSAISNGTIYVTTDEKAMYVDLNDTRIRLSQIITLSTYDWQNLTPPYSTEAFYYISDANALLKYNGTQWVQLNSTADLENSLKALGFLGTLDALPATGEKGQICTVGGQNYVYNPDAATDSKWVALSNIGGKFLDLEAAIDALDGRLDSAEATLERLDPAMSAAQTDIDNLEKVVGFIGKVETLSDSANVGDVCVHNDTVYVWVAAEGTAGGEGYVAAHWEAEGHISARIEELKAEIARVEQAAGTAEGVQDLATKLNSLETAVNHEETGLAATKAIADAAKAKADTAVQTATFTAFQEANTQEINGVKQSIQDTNTALGKTNAAIDAIKDGSTLDSFKDVEDKFTNYATKTEAQGYAAVVLGDADDTASEATVYGAKAAAALADQKAVDAANAASNAAAAAKTAQDTADEAKSIAEAAVTDSELEEAIKDFATKSELAAEKTAILGEENYGQTVKSAYTLAEGANTKANANEGAITAIKDGKTLDSFADVEAALENAKTENGNTYATKTELSNAQTAILGEAGYAQTVKSAYEKGVAAAGEAEKANAAITAMKADATITTFKGIEDKINNLTADNIGGMDAYATDDELSDAVAAVRGVTTETVASVNEKAKTNADAIEALDKEVDALAASVDKKIQAADAMTYEGTVSSEAELLAKTGVNKGDTYKAIADFKMNDDTTLVFIGDLLIATGTENEETGVLDTVVWDHVPSGYRADYVPALAVDNGTENDNSVVVNLTSAHADTGVVGDLGNITIAAAADSAVTITAINTANQAGSIAIGMAWGSF